MRNFGLRLLRLELLRGCPLACTHCSAEAGPARPEVMPLDRVRVLLADASRLGATEVIFTGGEPLEYPALPECLSVAKASGLRTRVFTTGISDKRDPACDARLLESLIPITDSFIFSVYSDSAESHDSITTVSGSWDLTTRAVRLVSRAGGQTVLSFLPLTQNFADLVGVAELAQESHVGEIRVLRLMHQGRAARNPSLSEASASTVTSVIAEARIIAPDVRIRVGGAASLYGGDTECQAPSEELFVDVNGWVSPCPGAIPQPSEPTSNVFISGLEGVWTASEELLAVRSLRQEGLTCAGRGCLAQLARQRAHLPELAAASSIPAR